MQCIYSYRWSESYFLYGHIFVPVHAMDKRLILFLYVAFIVAVTVKNNKSGSNCLVICLLHFFGGDIKFSPFKAQREGRFAIHGFR